MYLYENRGDGNLVLSLVKLTVKKDKWRANFGRALASVGDLDLDGYQGTINTATFFLFFFCFVCLFVF